MTAEEIRSIAEGWSDLLGKQEPGVYERATVTFLGEIAAQIAEANQREANRLAEGSFVSSVLDMLGSPAKEDGVELTLNQRVTKLQERLKGVPA